MGLAYTKRAQIWISAVLYVLMTAIIMMIVLEAGTPILKNMRDKAIFTQTRDNFVSLNQHIEDISNAGPGSQRLIPIQVKKGKLSINNEKVRWFMDTNADIIEPMSKISAGNLKVASDSDVDAFESGQYFILENFYIKAVFKKIGNESAYANITKTDPLDWVVFKQTGGIANGTFTLLVNDVDLEGNGFTRLDNAGYDMAKASVVAFVNTTSGANYTVTFTLYGDTDYLTVNTA